MDCLIDHLLVMPVDEIMQLEDLQERVRLYEAHREPFERMMKDHSRTEGAAVVTDLRGIAETFVGNRHIIYANGFALPSTPPIHSPVKIPYGAALPQQSGSLRSNPEGRILRPQGRIRKGEKAGQQNDSQKFPQYHVTSLPDLQYLDCLPQGADSFKTDIPQDTDILERYRPFRKGILPEPPIAAARERSELQIQIVIFSVTGRN